VYAVSDMHQTEQLLSMKLMRISLRMSSYRRVQ